MAIQILTGLPGHGKTSIAVERMMGDAEKGERLVYAAGFDGLDVPGVTILEDPRQWNAKDENGDYLVPDGSIVYVDESWKWFGHLHDASRAPTPRHVLDLAEHRHRGLDFVWTTQQPNQIYPFVRGLIEAHTHTVRRYGSGFLDVYRWEELNDDVKSVTRRENAEKSTRRLPEKAFGKYHSATVHTVKRRLPVRLFVMPIALIAGVAALWFAINMLKPKGDAAIAADAKEASAAGAAPPSSADDVQGRVKRYSTATEYLALTTPRIAAAPWTAPAFDGREVVAAPEVYCMASAGGVDGEGARKPASCVCITEQGTAYEMEPVTCRALARYGQPYNPFKQKRDERQGENRTERAQPRERIAPPVAQAPAMAGTPEQVASYGGMGYGTAAAVGSSPR